MTTRQVLAATDELFVGKGRDGMLARINRLPGAKVMVPSFVSFGTPGVPDADFVVKAATGAELPDAAGPGETVTYTTATDGASPLDAAAPAAETISLPDGSTASVWDVSNGAAFGRNLVTVVTHSTAVVAMTVLISGYDYLKRAMSELHTITATGTSKTVTGSKAFAYVRSVAITAAADASANTLNLGTGAKLGLPYALQKKAHLLQATIGGVQELINVASNAAVMEATPSAATTTTGDVRGSIAFNEALDGSKEATVWMLVASPNSGAGLVGVAQA
jgi:hypothetical protein